MGYNTEFKGQFEFNRKLTDKEKEAMKILHETRHTPHYEGKPSIWLQWVVESYKEVDYLAWDGGEKFYEYVDWLEYLIVYFFKPNKLSISGKVRWCGDDLEDSGVIEITDNDIELLELMPRPKELDTLIKHLYEYLDENDDREDLRDILIKLQNHENRI